MQKNSLTNPYIIVQVSGKQCFFQPGQWYDVDSIKEYKPFVLDLLFASSNNVKLSNVDNVISAQEHIMSPHNLLNSNSDCFLYVNKILLFKKKNQLQIGKPFLHKSNVPMKIIQQVKGKKITVLKTKPKKKYTRVRGHRQGYTRIQVDI